MKKVRCRVNAYISSWDRQRYWQVISEEIYIDLEQIVKFLSKPRTFNDLIKAFKFHIENIGTLDVDFDEEFILICICDYDETHEELMYYIDIYNS